MNKRMLASIMQEADEWMNTVFGFETYPSTCTSIAQNWSSISNKYNNWNLLLHVRIRFGIHAIVYIFTIYRDIPRCAFKNVSDCCFFAYVILNDCRTIVMMHVSTSIWVSFWTGIQNTTIWGRVHLKPKYGGYAKSMSYKGCKKLLGDVIGVMMHDLAFSIVNHASKLKESRGARCGKRHKTLTEYMNGTTAKITEMFSNTKVWDTERERSWSNWYVLTAPSK